MKHDMKRMFIVGSAALALAASSMMLPSLADAHGSGHSGSGRSGAHFSGGGHGGHFAGGGHRGGRGYAYGGGYYGGGYCGPIQIAAGLCNPY
jgi:hypothetical protein